MLKKSITYTDFNGQTRTEDFYFNLSKAEVMEFEIRNARTGGLESLLKEVSAAQDGNRIMDIFKDIIGRSYGVKGEDGRSFIKNPQLTQGFMGSDAYSELFMEFMYNPDKASEFINGILPQNVVSNEGHTSNPGTPQQYRPPTQDHQQKQPITRNVPDFPSVQQPQQPVQADPQWPTQQPQQYPGPERPVQDVQLPTQPDPYQQSRPAHEQGVIPQPPQFREALAPQSEDPSAKYDPNQQ